ncbi:hypothetical protein GCM10022240_02690 [Microbacterium kribbense]|uniref:2-oxoglutarate dehydrogenase n=1 Tax=Microbacterium kribbense TaxID=433645 RepID=A0ABP7G3K6_9MICO
MTPSDPVTRASRPARPPRPADDPRASTDPRGRRTRHRRGGIRTRAAAIAAIGALLLGPLLASAALAEDATPTPTPTPTPTLSGTVDAVLSPTSYGVLHEGRPLSVWAVLRNGTGYALSASTVALRLGTTPITDRTRLTAWLAGTAARPHLVAVSTATLDPVGPGQTEQTLVTVPAANPALHALKPGVYPLSATITHAAQATTVTSVVVVGDPKATAHTPVGLVVPITAGPLTAGLLTADELTTLTAPDGELTAALNAVAGTSAILAIDPAIPAAIRVLGTSAPQSATDWLSRLDTLPNDRFALQFGDADVATQIAGTAGTLLAPTSLQSYMAPADFNPTRQADQQTDQNGPDTPATASPTPTGTPTTAPDQPVYPTLARLQSLGPNTRDAVAWPFTGTADPQTVAAVAALPATAPATAPGSAASVPALTLVSSTSTAAGARGAAVPAHGIAGKAGVLVYDAAVSKALRAASLIDDPAVRGASLAAVTAYLDLAPHTAPLLVAVDRGTARSSLGLSSAVEAVTGAPNTTSASLTTLTDARAVPVTVRSARVDPTRSTALDTLLRGQARLGEFSAILADPTLITGPERASILQLLGGAWIGDPTGWQAAVTAHEKATSTTLAAVSIAPSSPINLAGTAAPLRFGVRNDLPWPVNVELIARPDDLRIEVQPNTPVVAHASSTTRVAVPVRARIGNGQSTISLTLLSPTGMRIGQMQTVRVTVHADWEVIGLTVLGVGIAGFLVLGLVRTIGARRRRQAADAADEASDAPDSPAGGDR